MPDMKVALQVYTIREHLQDLKGFTDAMRKVREIGYETVELAGVGPIDINEQKRVLDGEGLKVCSTHTGADELCDNMEAAIERHKLLGCEYVVSGPRATGSAEAYERFAKEGSAFGAKLAEAGLGYAYHNHSFEFERFGGRAAMQILLEESSPKLFNFELDTYWVQHGGASPAAWVTKLSGRVPLLHCKDMICFEDWKQTFAEVGEGNLEWPAIFDAAAKAGTKYLIVEEDACQRPSFESIAISFKNLEAMGMC